MCLAGIDVIIKEDGGEREMNYPHDKLFKETFSDLEVTTDFMQHYLPKDVLENLELDKLEVTKDSFVQEDLRDFYADLLFKTSIQGRESFVYFLFEHKSYPAENVALQMWGYMLEIYKRLVDKEKLQTLPVIIPILFYHGKNQSYQVKNLSEWIDEHDSSLHRFIPYFDILFYDFSEKSEEEIQGSSKLQAYLQSVKYIFAKEIAILLDKLAAFESVLYKEDKNYFDTIIIYIIASRDDLTLEKILGKLSEEGRKRVVTLAERLREEGVEKGIEKEKLKVAEKLLLLDVDKKKIMQATGLTKETLADLAEKLQ